jgi:pimeloyl-ACP methyl ester carboxylesterase
MGYRTLIIRVTVAGVILSLLVLALGFAFETRMRTGDANSYPPPGQLYSVDGYAMHLHCTGEGSPTVLFIGGAAALSFQDAAMQQRVSATTRTCIYDRAGYLWSDPRPEARTSWQLMDELHDLLATAQNAPPYVLVGSSNGGIYARVYAYLYPQDVAGLVMVDARLETELGKGGMLPTAILQGMGSVGLFRLFPGIICPPSACNPSYAEPIAVFRGYSSTLTTYDREVTEGLDGAAEQIRLLNTRLGTPGSLANLPIIILHANQFGLPVERLEPRLRDYVERYQSHYTALSSASTYRLIDSGHGIAVEHPDVVQGAIESIVLDSLNSF